MRLLMTVGLVVGFWFKALPAQAACSLDDSLMLARAGYSKAEIEAKCEGSGATSAGSGPTGSLPMEKVPGPREKVPGSVFRDCPDCPEMVVIPAGSFQMGSDAAEQKWADSQEAGWASSESPRHRVTIGYSLAVGKYEVTQAEWQSIMGNNPSTYPGPRNPVENVSWDHAREFIRRLNAKLRGTQPVSAGGDGPYRLLTEAEWEYAARAGTSTKFSWGDGQEGCAFANGPDLTAKSEDNDWSTSNCRDGYGIQTAPIGSFRANAFGLHDMHGNGCRIAWSRTIPAHRLMAALYLGKIPALTSSGAAPSIAIHRSSAPPPATPRIVPQDSASPGRSETDDTPNPVTASANPAERIPEY